MISKDDKKVKELPTVDVLGKKCWTPATCAKVLGVNRNMNMPIISAPVPCAKVYVPVEPFLAWVNFGQE